MVASITVGTTLDQMASSRNRFPSTPTDVIDVEVTTGQFCAVAAALDALGDHWSLLLVRDLLWHGSQSAADLAERNLGIHTADVLSRLERLEDLGLVESFALDAEPDTGFRLTALGRSADLVIRSLYGFGLNIMRRRPLTPATMCQVVAAAALDRHDEVARIDTTVVVGLEISGRTMGVVVAPGILRADATAETDVDVACTQDVFVDLLSGLVSVEDAIRRGELAVAGPVEPVAVVFDLLRQAPLR